MISKKLLFSIVTMILVSFFAVNAPAQRSEFTHTDAKGNLFVIAYDAEVLGEGASIVKSGLQEKFKGGEDGLEIIIIETIEPRAVAEAVAELSPKNKERLGGVIEVHMVKVSEGEEPSALIEVNHYPFGSLPIEHIRSPEYTFKFSSDSALLSIKLYEEISKAVRSTQPIPRKVEMGMASSVNPYMPPEFMGRCVRLVFKRSSDPTSPEKYNHFVEAIHAAAEAYVTDEGNYMMGVLSDKARRHAMPEDVHIQIYPFVYPSREFSDEEEAANKEKMSTQVGGARPFSTGLYYISGLKPLVSYDYKIIDSSKGEDDFWYRVDEGSFLTSSLRGIVRTVPNKLEKYAAMPSFPIALGVDPPKPDELDFVIENTTIFDGTLEAKRFIGDVGIAGERIQAVGDLSDEPRRETIDGEGLFLMPGFIDIHSHADSNMFSVPYAPSHIRQGITTVLGGNCSFSVLGIGSLLAELNETGAGVNVAMLIGNRPVRDQVMGRRKGQPTYAEAYRMKELVDLAMEEGGFGMASGLIYSISEEAHTWELAELSKQLKPYGGFYASHIRGETDEVCDAAREAIFIGELAEVPVQISHMKVINKRNWGDMERYVDIIRKARERGFDVTGDQYPWRASGPAAHYTLHKLLVREAIYNETPDVILLKDMPGKYEKYSGRPLTDLLEGENMTPIELLDDLNLTSSSKIYCSYLCLSPEDVRLPMKEDFIMVCTDASLASQKNIDAGKHWDDHPRKFRSYPEFFAKYVRDEGVCSWELGVWKSAGLPAQKLKLHDRGVIKPGAFADIVLLDPKTLDPGSDYRDQAPPPKGFKWVFLNGVPVLKEGEMANKTAGRPLWGYGHHKP